MINIKRELKNIGIKPIEEISVQEKTNIAERVANKLVSLNVPGISHSEILEKLFQAKMYRASMTGDERKAKYYYKNRTIYFEKNLSLTMLNEEIMRECIHYLQDQRDQLKRMGLCTFRDNKTRGMALNEVGISYISNKLLTSNIENKAFTLLKQTLLITGEEALFDSILNNSDKFKERFIKKTNSEVLYSKVQNTFDAMSDLEQIIKRLSIEGRKSSNPQRYLSKINMHKHTLNIKFSETQWQIYNRYFSRKIELIDQVEEIASYREELFNFSQLLEIAQDEEKYTNFIAKKCEKLNKIEAQLLRLNANNSMILFEKGTINRIIKSIKKIIFKSKEYKKDQIKTP